jgi:hypothetical protein
MGNNIISKLVNEVMVEKKKDLLKEQMRRILTPIINEEIRTFREPTRYVEEFKTALKSAAGDWVDVKTNLNGDRIIFDDGESGLNFSAELDILGLDNFTLVYRLGDVSARHKLYNQTADDIKEWIKTDLKDRKKERSKQDKIDRKKEDVEEDLGDESTEVKKVDTQLKKADKLDKDAKKAAGEEKPKGKDDERGMKDATGFKRQVDAKDKATIAKGGKVSKAKEMPSDKEKTIKKPKTPNRA